MLKTGFSGATMLLVTENAVTGGEGVLWLWAEEAGATGPEGWQDRGWLEGGGLRAPGTRETSLNP